MIQEFTKIAYGYFDNSLHYAQIHRDPPQKPYKDKKTSFLHEKDTIIRNKIWHNMPVTLPEYYRVQQRHDILVNESRLSLQMLGVSYMEARDINKAGFLKQITKASNAAKAVKSCDKYYEFHYQKINKRKDVLLELALEYMKELGSGQALLHLRAPNLTSILQENADMTVLPISDEMFERINSLEL